LINPKNAANIWLLNIIETTTAITYMLPVIVLIVKSFIALSVFI